MKATVVAVVAAVLLASAAGAAAAQSEEPTAPKVLDLLGAGPATVFPFDGDHDTFAAVGITLQALPVAQPERLTLGTAPQHLASGLALDVLWPSASMDEAMVGVSLRLYETQTSLPVRLGLTRPSGVGWAGYVKIDLPLR